MLSLGAAPDDLSVVVVAGADFNCTLKAELGGVPQNWPAGAEISLQFGEGLASVIWPAAVAGNLATWNVDQVDVDTTIAAGYTRARLWYANGEVRQLWASGWMAVRG